jgi:hypothetical protein
MQDIRAALGNLDDVEDLEGGFGLSRVSSPK